MSDDTWYAFYASRHGEGIAKLDFDAGAITSVDQFGGKWEGTYQVNQVTELLDVKLKVTFPPGIMDRVSDDTSSEDLEEIFDVSLPNQTGREATFRVFLRNEPLEVRFEMIRDAN